MFFTILSVFTLRPEIILVIVPIISSISMDAIGIMKRSLAEFVKSLSCHSVIFSKETLRFDLIILAKEETLSLFMGFFLTGTALLPICPFLNDSWTSPISVRCRFLISTAILSSVEAMRVMINIIYAYL